MSAFPSFFVRYAQGVHLGVVFLGAIAVAVAPEPAQNVNAAIQKHRKGDLVVEAPPGTVCAGPSAQ